MRAEANKTGKKRVIHRWRVIHRKHDVAAGPTNTREKNKRENKKTTLAIAVAKTRLHCKREAVAAEVTWHGRSRVPWWMAPAWKAQICEHEKLRQQR